MRVGDFLNESGFYQRLDKINQRAKFNGAVAIVDAKETRYQAETGWADFDRKIPFTTATVTGLGSVTKQFTAIAVLRLLEEKRLALDLPISCYVPGYRWGNQVTLRHVLNMASGIPDYTDCVANLYTQELREQGVTDSEIPLKIDQRLGEHLSIAQILELINQKSLIFQPGSQFAYSNTNYALLTAIIESVSGQSYSEFLHEQIFSPLGMRHTHVGTRFSGAQSYQYLDHKIVAVGKGDHQLGDGSIVTNLSDFKRYAQAVIQKEILQAQTWELPFKLEHEKYGMGWMKLNSWFWHSGQILGYWADFFLTPDRRTAMVWLYNISPTGTAEKQWLAETDKWREDYWQEIASQF